MTRKKLRRGYTTGTCAQAATKAAMQMLLSGKEIKEIQAELPGGGKLTVPVLEADIRYAQAKESRLVLSASCAVKKDSGDDPDITDGVLVYSKVSWSADTSDIVIAAGEGIGHITKPGLSQPVGAAAVSRVPRQMIEKEVEEALKEAKLTGGILVELSIPGGRELALKTFNPRLGIEGGLSILGTSGIVEPMSEKALVDTIRAEISVKLAQGRTCLLIAPGNYGLHFLRKTYKIEETEIVKCSNFIGQTIDMAAEAGCRKLLLIGHIGKLIKVSGGIMNTHSKWADCRMELFAAAALKAGLGGERALKLLDCVTTDEALGQCSEEERRQIMGQVMKSIEKYLGYRAEGGMETGAAVYSNEYGLLGMTENGGRLIETFCEETARIRRQERKWQENYTE